MTFINVFQLITEIVELQSPEATKYIDRVLLNIKEFVNTPHRELHSESLWTNNACESLNNILNPLDARYFFAKLL